MHRITSRVVALARREPGPWFASPVECEACGFRWTAIYARPPLRFSCPRCSRPAGLRADAPPTPDTFNPGGPPWTRN